MIWKGEENVLCLIYVRLNLHLKCLRKKRKRRGGRTEARLGLEGLGCDRQVLRAFLLYELLEGGVGSLWD